MTQWVYDFSEGSKDMRELLGGKGANVAEMTRVLGADKVPAGFTITTEACVAYMEGGQEFPDGLEEQIADRRDRIDQLKRDFVRQKVELRKLDGNLAVARKRLTDRVVRVYIDGGNDGGEWLLGSTGISDMLDRAEAASQVVGLDQNIVSGIGELERQIRVKRSLNHDVQAEIRAQIGDIQSSQAEVERETLA